MAKAKKKKDKDKPKDEKSGKDDGEEKEAREGEDEEEEVDDEIKYAGRAPVIDVTGLFTKDVPEFSARRALGSAGLLGRPAKPVGIDRSTDGSTV